MENAANNKERIYSVLQAVPRGHVVSYGQLAKLAGLPRAARLVGTVLSQLPGDSTLPWHRVVKANGQIAFPIGSPRYNKQKARLVDESIAVTNGRISLKEFGWQP